MCEFVTKTTAIHSLWHGLHTLTAMPESTQPSTLCGMVKWVPVSAFRLIAACRWTDGPSCWLVWESAAIYIHRDAVDRLEWFNNVQCSVCIDAGHLLAKVSWACQQSNSDVEITGYHILVNGKQYGSLLHEGIDCLRIKVVSGASVD